ncbi:MAG: hypothetical protein PHI53_01005 [Candidatus Pacebacteria bacterium]|nr:hypothetical protein [Candidatus Paceibacterota bacterium]
MPDGYKDKDYGDHRYNEIAGDNEYNGKTYCEHGCGCWIDSFGSGGPAGVDPLGSCPNNPKDGILIGGQGDYENFIKQRIAVLEARLRDLEGRLIRVTPTKTALSERIVELERKNSQQEEEITRLRRRLRVLQYKALY